MSSNESITRLGVLSDTHDRCDAAAAAVETLRAAGAQFLIHCGDVGGERILDLLAGFPAVFVWGNCDYDRAGLARYAADIGVDCRGNFAELTLGGVNIAVTHGDDAKLIRRATADDSPYQYLFVGHTHVSLDQRIGHVRIVNPGALQRTARKTVAIVDLPQQSVRHLIVSI
jgi:putative phosphoesterase